MKVTLLDLMLFASAAMDVILLLIAIWGLIAFFPRKSDRGNNAPAWLILAIWLGFLAWCLSYIAALELMWKGIAIVAVYMHFFARWKAISPSEQKHWTPLMMGFYPDIKHWAVRSLTFWKTKHRDAYYTKAEQEAQDKEVS